MASTPPSDVSGVSLERVHSRLDTVAEPVDRTDRIPLSVAVGRVLATDATANEPVSAADITAGDTVFESGYQLRPADLGLLKAAGINELLVRQRPQIGIVPTGDEFTLDTDQAEQAVETAGFTLAQYVDRWGGKVTYRNPVADDAPALQMAVQRDLTRDAIVVTGTEPGDTLRDVVSELGAVRTDTVAMDPGGTAGVAVVEDRPILLLPESPTGARVAAVQFLRPLLKHFAAARALAHPSQDSTLTASIDSRESISSFVPVSVGDDGATPLSGDDLGSVTRADGWVSVPAGSSGHAAGDTVEVENWEYLP